MTGRTIAHYRIEEKLGEGGMGVVYRAIDTRLNRPVALKLLRPETTADPERKKRFVQEAKAASALNHPGLVTIYDINHADGVDFIAMEYVPGKTVDQVIGRKGLALAEVLRAAIQIADALAAAHGGGIIHRDLKPGNIMLADSGRVKVLDFGLAKLTAPVEEDDLAATQAATLEAGSTAPRTQEGAILGTIAYMSPEQAEGKKVDGRSDIFSFGCVLYEMVTGRRSFAGETKVSTLSAILRDEPRPVSEIVPGAPAELERIIARCLRKDPQRRFQHMDDIRVALEELKEESESGMLAARAPARPKAGRRWIIAAATAAVATMAGLAGILWLVQRPRAPDAVQGLLLTRLTSDAGLAADPAISPDGNLLAYASDRGGEGNLDIWIQQLAGRNALRITQHAADDREPAFSPDGSRLAFRSDREGGGIYLVSTLGGEERRIADFGRRPRFSPDGNWIAYWVGDPNNFIDSKIYVIPSGGGLPQQVRPEFRLGFYPIWSPDGKFLLFLGSETMAQFDWWVAPRDGGAPTKTGALEVFRNRGLTVRSPGVWLAENHIVFSAAFGDTSNLWQIPLSPGTWRAGGAPQRLTFGTGQEGQPSATPDGRLVFSSLSGNADLWTLRLDAQQGKPAGDLQQITHDTADDFYPSPSADGKKIAFLSKRSGNNDVWLRDQESGKEKALTFTAAVEAWPKITPDGSRVAFNVLENDRREIYAVDIGRGATQKLCDACGRLWHWSPDGRKLLYQKGSPVGVALLDIATGSKTDILKHPTVSIWEAHFSPDGRWVVFHTQNSPQTRQLFVAPFREADIPMSDWIALTDGSAMDRNACWSPDGNTVYFLSERDGFRCVWAQRLDRATRRPAGPVFGIYHAHNARRSLVNLSDPAAAGPSVASGKLVFSMGELSGNVWMARKPDQK